VHFDPPADPKDYTHRSGRTARAGATGLVVSLVSADQQRAVGELQRALLLPIGFDAADLAALGSVAAPEPAGIGVSSDGSRPIGTLTWFDRRRGFGFIARDRGPDLFVHVSAIEAADAERIIPGQRVAFFVGWGRKGEEARGVRAA
jgi:CspA family cold shock protein